MQRVRIELPEATRFLVAERARYKCPFGGRGAVKSWSAARALLGIASCRQTRILCAREYQNSIADSVHKLLCDQIGELGLLNFDPGKTSIVHKLTRSEFIFAGLHHNVQSIKSKEGIDICWVEEAETVSEESWATLIPTIRKPGSEIWITFNPGQETDPTYQRFVVHPPPDILYAFGSRIPRAVSWKDNPWLPDVLRQEAEHLRKTDPEAYMHVWEGMTWSRSDSQILAGKWKIDAFVPVTGSKEAKDNWDGPYFGADWGFAQDPTTLLKMWVHGRRLYIEHEAYKVGCEIVDTPALFDKVPDSRKYRIYADNARPETISHVKEAGFNIAPCEKWKGSVEDGITFLRSFDEIVIHPRCKNTIVEARLYSYKVDKRTNDVLPEVQDKNNHCWDAARYGLGPMIQLSVKGTDIFRQFRKQPQA